MYRFRVLKVHHLVYFDHQNLKSDPELGLFRAPRRRQCVLHAPWIELGCFEVHWRRLGASTGSFWVSTNCYWTVTPLGQWEGSCEQFLASVNVFLCILDVFMKKTHLPMICKLFQLFLVSRTFFLTKKRGKVYALLWPHGLSFWGFGNHAKTVLNH